MCHFQLPTRHNFNLSSKAHDGLLQCRQTRVKHESNTYLWYDWSFFFKFSRLLYDLLIQNAMGLDGVFLRYCHWVWISCLVFVSWLLHKYVGDRQMHDEKKCNIPASSTWKLKMKVSFVWIYILPNIHMKIVHQKFCRCVWVNGGTHRLQLLMVYSRYDIILPQNLR